MFDLGACNSWKNSHVIKKILESMGIAWGTEFCLKTDLKGMRFCNYKSVYSVMILTLGGD